MLLKILFTLAVIVGVIVFFRHRRRAPAVAEAAAGPSDAGCKRPRHRRNLLRCRVGGRFVFLLGGQLGRRCNCS